MFYIFYTIGIVFYYSKMLYLNMEKVIRNFNLLILLYKIPKRGVIILDY